ncbi:MAG: hypothetical protein WCW04_01005 [Candidatus Paceibacterota bacterium]
MKEKLDDIYTDFQAQQVAQENPDSFWSKFIINPFEKFVVKIKKKKIYSITEKRVLVEKRKEKRLANDGKVKPKKKKTKKLKKPK